MVSIRRIWATSCYPSAPRAQSGARRAVGRRAAWASSVAVLALLAGCADTPNAQTDGGPEEAQHNRVDVMFAQMMIPHHDDAIAMAQYLEQVDGVNPRVDSLAAGIVEAQVVENRQMNEWLTQLGYPEVASSPGEVDADAVAGSSTDDIEESFLTEMIAHHEHGVDMARGAANRGESPFMTGLAQGMIEDQGREIDVMRDMLNEE